MRVLACLSAFLLLVSCGGGGGDGSPTSATVPAASTGSAGNGSAATGASGNGSAATGTSGNGSAATGASGTGSTATTTPPASGSTPGNTTINVNNTANSTSGSTSGSAANSGSASNSGSAASGGSAAGTGAASGGSTTPASFTAAASNPPADGATISGVLRINIVGSGIGNVELLPPTAYSPLYMRGTVTGDGVAAFIDFNSALFPNGPLQVRVAAFNQPPGGGGSEITAMSARTWNINNPAGGASSGTFAATLVAAPPNNAFLGSDSCCGLNSFNFIVTGVGMKNVELVSANNETIRYGTFTVTADGRFANLDWNFYTFGYGAYDLKILAWDVPAGQAGNKIEVMSARHYTVHLPLGCQAERTCGGNAP